MWKIQGRHHYSCPNRACSARGIRTCLWSLSWLRLSQWSEQGLQCKRYPDALSPSPRRPFCPLVRTGLAVQEVSGRAYLHDASIPLRCPNRACSARGIRTIDKGELPGTQEVGPNRACSARGIRTVMVMTNVASASYVRTGLAVQEVSGQTSCSGRDILIILAGPNRACSARGIRTISRFTGPLARSVRTGLAVQEVSGPATDVVARRPRFGSPNRACSARGIRTGIEVRRFEQIVIGSEQGLQCKRYPDVYDNMIRILTIDQIPNIHSHTFRAFSFFCWAFSISSAF